VLLFFVALARSGAPADPAPFRFAILGDRTGSVQPGVYEQVWREVSAAKPEFVVTVGDIIEGSHDASAESEWREVQKILQPYRAIPLYLTPGNHDIWSAASEKLFRQHAGHAPSYSFDHAQAHFTILDNSRSDELSAETLEFLEKDLKDHASQPVKFIFSHRPSWLFHVTLRNPDFAQHRLARQYGARHVIAGHVHQMMRGELDGITYISMPSSGGHLRGAAQYEAGWFFGYALVEVRGADVQIQFHELKAPHGQGRVTQPSDWSLFGLAQKPQRAAGGSRSAGIPAR
jgi:UDP-2,3-diacylglucosamine pyrophosphatase LpxH